jgi:galactonate dehydratase
MPIFEGRLADYVMPDVVWTGGISELMRIATMAEAYYVPISPHNAMGPIQILAGAHAMMAVPNFYRLEFSVRAIPHYQACLTAPIAFEGDAVVLSGRPGLGHDLDVEYLRSRAIPGWENDSA